MEINSEMSSSKRKLEVEIESYKDSLEEVKQQLQLVSCIPKCLLLASCYFQLEQEKAQKEKDCVSLDIELGKVNDALSKITKEKGSLEDRVTELTNSLQSEEDKSSRLNKLKNKLEASLQEVKLIIIITVLTVYAVY